MSRKDFIRNSALTMAGLPMTSGVMAASTFSGNKTILTGGKLSLKNVRLETGFEYEEGEVISTKTGLFYIEIENAKITKVAPNQPDAKATDAKGLDVLVFRIFESKS